MHHGLVLQLDLDWMKRKREKRVKIYLIYVKESNIAVKKNEKTDSVVFQDNSSRLVSLESFFRSIIANPSGNIGIRDMQTTQHLNILPGQ